MSKSTQRAKDTKPTIQGTEIAYLKWPRDDGYKSSSRAVPRDLCACTTKWHCGIGTNNGVINEEREAYKKRDLLAS